MTTTRDLSRWAWLSIAAALLTMGLKSAAYLVTGSVGLLSDALESSVNLVAAVLALIALRVASRPADANHPFGHGKVEYLSAGAEGVMIVVAAGVIIVSAVDRLVHPEPLESLGIGLVITLVAAGVNLVVGLMIVRAGRRHRSWTLVADGKHLLTDVWTSVGVIVGVALVALTGWLRLDPVIALLVGANILWTGSRLVMRSTAGLMDHALPPEDHAVIVEVLERFTSPEVHFHALQTREAGHRRFVSVHVLVPGAWTVQQGHDLLEEIESAIADALPDCEVHTHLEPVEDERAYKDAHLGVALPKAPRTDPQD